MEIKHEDGGRITTLPVTQGGDAPSPEDLRATLVVALGAGETPGTEDPSSAAAPARGPARALEIPGAPEARQGRVDRLEAALAGVPLTTVAEALAGLEAAPLRAVLAALPREWLANIVSAAATDDPAAAVDILQRLSRPEAADVLEEMAPDDAADVLGELRDEDAPAAEQLLREMETEEAADVRQLLAYPPDTAGGLMTTDYLRVLDTDTVGEAVRRVRTPTEDEVAPESASYVYVTRPDGVLVGVVPWHRLLRSGERVPVRALLEPRTVSAQADADQEAVARLVRQQRLLAVPVVDAAGTLLGIVTADDVADVEEEEATEDIERLGGSQPLEEPYLRAGVFTLARKRLGWLLLLFAAEAYTGTVLRHFEDELTRVVALSFFIPLLIGTGGNTGSQTVTTVIRAMAVGEVGFRDLFRVWRKEVTTAAILAAAMAAATAGRAWTLGVQRGVGETVALTAAAIVLWAATVAALLPLLLRRLRIDPAVVSAPLITTLVDGTGLVLYFEIARRVLQL